MWRTILTIAHYFSLYRFRSISLKYTAMYEYKYSIREVSYQPIDIMGNFFDSPLLSEPKEHRNATSLQRSTSIMTKETSMIQGETSKSWYANINDVENLVDGCEALMSLTLDEKQKVKRFKFPDDQKRALLSILLQRSLIRKHFNTKDGHYEIIRSREVSSVILGLMCT